MPRDRSLSDDQHLPLTVLHQIDALCDEFEGVLDTEEIPRLGVFVKRVDPSGRRHLVKELVTLALDHLAKQGVADPQLRLREANRDIADELETLIPTGDSTVVHVPRNATHNATRGAACDHRAPRRGLNVHCPHCQSPVAMAPDAELANIRCDSCNSDFSLVQESLSTEATHAVTRVGHFDLFERVGMGGFGTVWKAKDTRLDRTVAIKIPRKGQFDHDQENAFLREAQNAAQLNHSGIVPVHEVGRDGDTLYIVSDFVRGKTLTEELNDQRPGLRKAAELCVKVADALHHAHERGVIHRDLKPSNIMLDAQGEPHLMDFGLARRETGEITMSIDGQVLGTPAYMSPEQARGESRRADSRSDVYSLGVILFQLLTGELPFRGNAHMLLHQVIHDEAPSPRKLNAAVPKDLETIVVRCLEKEPKARFATAADLGDELQRFLDGVPIHSRPIGPLERFARWCKRYKAAAIALALLTVLMLSLGVFGLREMSMRQQLRLQLSDNLIQTAALHGRKGEWAKVVEQLNEAEELGSRDPIRLRIERIHALESLNLKEEAMDELASLASFANLGPHEAEVRMLQGMDLLVSDGFAVAEPYLLQAKSLGGLSPSNEALINSMLAETSSKSLREIRRAVEADRFDQAARRFLTFLLYTAGNIPEARLEAEAGQILFPSDPNFPILLAQIALVEGRPDEMEQHLGAPAIQQMEIATVKEFGRALQMVDEYKRQVVDFWDFSRIVGISDEKWNQPQIQEMLFSSPLELPEANENNPQYSELLEQVHLVGNMLSPGFERRTSLNDFPHVIDRGPRCFAVAYAPLTDLFSLRTIGFLEQGRGNVERIDLLIDRLAMALHAHPEAFLAYARGQLLFVRGRRAEAAEAFQFAALHHSSFGDYEGVSSFAAARCYFELYLDGNLQALENAARHLRKRLDRGNIPRHHAEALYEIAVESKDHASTRELIDVLTKHGLRRDERLLRLASVDLEAGEYLSALRHAVEVNPESPQAERAAEIARQSRDSLQGLLEFPPPEDAAGN